jgi:hypothetical protein
MRRITLLTLLVTAISSPVAAQWLHTSKQDAFDDKSTQMAMTASSGYFMGFTCQSKDKSQFVFATPEEFEKSFEMAKMLDPKLLFRVDTQPVKRLEVEFDNANGKLRAIVLGDEAVAAAKEMISAKQRIAVAIEIGDKKFHSTDFGVANSRPALTKALKACGIQ